MQKYINFLTEIPTTKSVKPTIRLRTENESIFEDFDENVLSAWEKIRALLKQPFVFTDFQLRQYNIRKSQIEANDDNTQAFMQLKELHSNFIDDNSFINIGQVITHTMKLIAEKESLLVDQTINDHQKKANAKNIFGSLLHDALSHLAIRVTCGATSSESNKYPITHFHIRCVCCNETICLKTIDLSPPSKTGDIVTTEESESNSKWLFDELTDFVINDFLKRHIFRSYQSLKLHKKTPSVTAIIDNENERYEGPKFSEGCEKFDAYVIHHYPSIKLESENVTQIDATVYGDGKFCEAGDFK